MYDASDFGIQVSRNYGNYQLVHCPYHNDRHASAFFFIETGNFYCKSCGARKRIEDFVTEFEHVATATHSKLPSFVSRPSFANPSQFIDILDSDAGVNYAHIFRGISKSTLSLCDVRWNTFGESVTFIQRDEQNDICGNVQRVTLPHSTFRYYVHGKVGPIWPIEAFSIERSEPLFVSEGPWKAMRIMDSQHRLGIAHNSFALFTSTPTMNTHRLLWQYNGPIVLIVDNDDAGSRLMGCFKSLHKNIRCFRPKVALDDISDQDRVDRIVTKMLEAVSDPFSKFEGYNEESC